MNHQHDTNAMEQERLAISGFFSYCHKDNTRGQLTQLAADIQTEYEVQTGRELDLFVDKSSIMWGDRWKESIKASIDTVSFFIPILSPLYFNSASCRSELRQYLNIVNRTGSEEIILPIYYVEASQLDPGNNEDELGVEIREIQWEDWRALRFKSRDSEEYLCAVAKLVTRLVASNDNLLKRLEERATAQSDDVEESRVVISSVNSDEKGAQAVNGYSAAAGFYFDSLNVIDELIPEFTETTEALGEGFTEAGMIAAKYTERINGASELQRASSSWVLSIFHSMASELTPVANNAFKQADAISTTVTELDIHVRTAVAYEFQFQNDEDRASLQKTLSALPEQMKETREGLASFSCALSTVKGLSRELSKPLNTIDKAVRIFEGSCDVVESWAKLYG